MKKLFVLAFVFICVSSCAYTPPLYPTTMSDEERHTLGRIGVISLLGDEFTLQHVAGPLLKNRNNKSDVKDWNIDAYVIDTATRFLQKKGYEVVKVNYDAVQLFDVYTRASTQTDRKIRNIAPELLSAAQTQGIDSYVFFFRYLADDFIGQSGVPVAGYGLYHQQTRQGAYDLATYVAVEADVGSVAKRQIFASNYLTRSTRLKPFFWFESYEEKTKDSLLLNDQHREELEKLIKDELGRTVDMLLGGLGL